MTPTLAPSPTVSDVLPLQTWRVPVTLDGYVEVQAANRWAAQAAFEKLSVKDIAETLDLWAGDPEPKPTPEGTTS